MQTVGDAIRRGDVEPDLLEFIRTIPAYNEMSCRTIREKIGNGRGGFTEAEGILLLLDGIVRRAKGESEW